MTSALQDRKQPHLFAALCACALVGIVLAAGRLVAVRLEHHDVVATVLDDFPLKNQGLAFQRAAVLTRNVLPLYGSSELLKPIDNKSSVFFSTAPTGFRVSPAGKPGTTSLVIAQRLGALGSDLHAKKIAISLSPSWFLVPALSPHFYEGNFSLLAAGEMTFGSAFDFALKRDLATRMLEFPHPLEKSPILGFALRRLSSGTIWDRLLYYASWPAGKMENLVLDLQDHFEALLQVALDWKSKPPPLDRHEVDWAALIAEADKAPISHEGKPGEWIGGMDEDALREGGPDSFVNRMNEAREWTDFELLLRSLTAVHAHPLLVSMPLDGSFYERAGLPRSVRDAYYSKLRSLAHRYNLRVISFEEHDTDPAFLEGHHYHLTAKGWTYYNRVLDDFFHDRPPRTDHEQL